MRNIPQGEKMLMSGFFSSDWRIGMVNGHSVSTSQCLLCHEVCKETFLTSTLPLHDAGLICSAASGSSLESRFIAGTFSYHGARSN